MPKVICTLPNASDSINGVAFGPHVKGVVSSDISEDVAAEFLKIPGYELESSDPPTKGKKEPVPASAE